MLPITNYDKSLCALPYQATEKIGITTYAELVQRFPGLLDWAGKIILIT